MPSSPAGICPAQRPDYNAGFACRQVVLVPESNISTLDFAHINRTRTGASIATSGRILIAQARYLYRRGPSRLDVDGIVYSIPSATYDETLPASLCPWARLHITDGVVWSYSAGFEERFPHCCPSDQGAVHVPNNEPLCRRHSSTASWTRDMLGFQAVVPPLYGRWHSFCHRGQDNMMRVVEEHQLMKWELMRFHCQADGFRNLPMVSGVRSVWLCEIMPRNVYRF